MSKRKQKLKKADFQKTKLKVGKTAPKPKNYTDTAFTTRTISIRAQHLTPTTDIQETYRRKLSLLRHHNVTVRKETLEQFQRTIPDIIKSNIMTVLLRQAIPLMCDPSKLVRDNVLTLLKTVGEIDTRVLSLHCNLLVLYVHMAMTHITSGIQAQSTAFLECLLKFCAEDIVRQGWVKLLNGVLTVLGWGGAGKNTTTSGGGGGLQTRRRDSKYTKAHLDALRELVRYGCCADVNNGNERETTDEGVSGTSTIDRYSVYLIPSIPQPYEYLRLFTRELRGKGKQTTSNGSTSTSSGNVNGKSTVTLTSTDSTSSSFFVNQDIDTRRQLFKRQYLQYILDKTTILSKEGGDLGRSANNLKQLLLEIF